MKNLSLKIQNILQKYKSLFFVFIFLLLFCYIYKINIPLMNADLCSQILEADDILKGNIFLNDWYLTGITFLTTDMPFCILSTLFFKVSLKSAVVGYALNIFFCFLCAFFLTKNSVKKLTVFNLILFLLFYGFSYSFLSRLNVHSGCFFCSYIILFIAHKYLTSQNIKYLICVFILLALTTFSDMSIIPITIVPMLIYSLIKIYKNNDKMKYINLILSLVLGCIAGLLLLKIFLYISSAVYNYCEYNFIDLKKVNFIDRIILLIKEISVLYGVDFYNKKLIDFYSIASFLNIIIILLSGRLIYKNIKKCTIKNNPDFINFCLSFSVAIMLLLLLLTTYNLDIDNVRYIAFIPINSSVLILRSYKYFKYTSKHKKIMIIAFLFMMFFVNIFSIKPKYDETMQECLIAKQLVEVLRKYDLKNGINNDYWFSNNVSVYSNNKVKVRNYVFDDNNLKIQPYTWFFKNDWQNEPVEFIILNNEIIKPNSFESELKKKSKQIVSLDKFKIYILKKTYKNYFELNNDLGMIRI